MVSSDRVIYAITCGLCGQSWQTRAATDGQVIQCLFCGSKGQLRVGADWKGVQRVEVWLQCAQIS